MRGPEHVLSHQSAAALWGLDVPDLPERQVTVPRNLARHIDGVVRHRADLGTVEVTLLAGERVTSPLRTVLDCIRTQTFGWGLATADSALRSRLLTADDLRGAVGRTRGPGATTIRRVAAAADHRAASCLESLTRALCLEAEIGPLALQARIFRNGHPYDLEVVGSRVLIEADGAAGHRTQDRFVQDCEDITVAAREGYVVLRVTWYDVTQRPVWTVDAIRRAVRRQSLRLRREAAAQARVRSRSLART